MFIKPREVHKAFTGYVLTAFRDLIPTAHRHEIIGVGHYQGDPFVHPDAATVRAAVVEYRPEAPAAYGIDFGVTADGRTLLLEVNDADSLGHIGLRPVPYANMLEDRWLELMAQRPV